MKLTRTNRSNDAKNLPSSKTLRYLAKSVARCPLTTLHSCCTDQSRGAKLMEAAPWHASNATASLAWCSFPLGKSRARPAIKPANCAMMVASGADF